ncbi:MAG: ribonuclease HI [Sphaerochaetaceae bacterium]|nr:ribonuclease HI [Spirochaetales bacterium]MDY5498529.1 ribonuclease HI [Sphaerochaetaceae bacterium]
MSYQRITIYTDGGCSGNPGPGGWAFTLDGDGAFQTEMHGGEKETTNNKMELTAVIQALSYAKQLGAAEINVFTDSQYVKNGITVWIKSWKTKGWKTADKKPVKNQEYWVKLDALVSSLPVSFHWVKGHAGIELNERCDTLVQQAIAQYR